MMIPAKDSLDIGLVVSDGRASLEFYQDVLGLRLVETMTMTSGTMHRLRFGTSELKLVELEATPPRGTVGLGRQLGFRYVTFAVTNLSELCERLRGLGVEFSVPEKEIRPGVRIAMVKDPDGNIVEFSERE